MVSATADSNIYISALIFGGLPDRCLAMARAGFVSIAISNAIEAEVMRVLRDKFRWDSDALKEATEQLKEFTYKVWPLRTVDEVKEDPSDNRIIECALAAESTYIITGDNDLLRRKEFERIRIVSAAEFLMLEGLGLDL